MSDLPPRHDPRAHADGEHGVWAENVADRIVDRLDVGVDVGEPSRDDPIVVKGGISPSGVPHLGNLNEVLRGYFVAEALRDRGYAVRQVFTTDDRDPLRKVPRALATLDGEVVGLDEVDAGALGRNLGKPYTDVPDPFGCCDSYGDHFSTLIEESAALLGVDVDVISTTDLYEDGSFEALTRRALERRDRVREVLSEHQASVGEDYVPFTPQCGECGKLTGEVTAVELGGDGGPDGRDDGEPVVEYRCTDLTAGERTIEGCGHEGTATLREGKLPWRLEWPAGWDVLGVDFEPFGKDHAEGSWPSGVDLAENALDVEPPVGMVYEWFTLDGEPFSSSEGHVALAHDVLDVVEPEVLRFFFGKDPGRARDFSVERLDQLVDEFDALERRYFGEDVSDDVQRVDVDDEEDSSSAIETERAEALYPAVIRPTVAETFDDALPGSWPADADDPEFRAALDDAIAERFVDRARIPFTFAAVLGMFDDPDSRATVARQQGHLPAEAPEWVEELALRRVERATAWARRTGNEFDYELQRSEIPEANFDAGVRAALEDLADFVDAGHDGEAIQGEIYETAKRHDVPVGDFFAAGYRLFLDEDQGPKLGPFLAKLDREFVVDRLRRER